MDLDPKNFEVRHPRSLRHPGGWGQGLAARGEVRFAVAGPRGGPGAPEGTRGGLGPGAYSHQGTVQQAPLRLRAPSPLMCWLFELL